jgi:hypothetical protein
LNCQPRAFLESARASEKGVAARFRHERRIAGHRQFLKLLAIHPSHPARRPGGAHR